MQSGNRSRWRSGFARAGFADPDSEWDDATAFSVLTEQDEAEPVSAMTGQLAAFPDVEQPSEEPGPGRSILRSLGSLIWIALLIAFSLSGRACGD
jgi:hypothetical protein